MVKNGEITENVNPINMPTKEEWDKSWYDTILSVLPKLKTNHGK